MELRQYMQENRDRNLGVDMDRLRRLQQSGDQSLCREQLAIFEDAFGRAGGQQQFGQNEQQQFGQDDQQQFGLNQDQNRQRQRQLGQDGQQFGQNDVERDSDGQIVVRQPAPSVRIDQAEPRVTVRQTAPDVRVSQPQPEIIVRQPAPQVTVNIPQPQITVRMPDPNVQVEQREPQVEVSQSEPEVRVAQPEQQARVMLEQDQQPQVRIQRPSEQANIQLQRAGQPQVRYESEEPQVRIQRAQGEPDVTFERVERDQANAASGQRRQDGQDMAAMQDRQQAGFEGQGQRQGLGMGGDELTTGSIQRVTAEELTGMPLVNRRGQQLGEIETVVINTADDRAMAIVQHGGFMGLGEKRIAMPLDELSLTRDAVVVSGMTDQDVGDMPEWNDNSRGYRELDGNEPAQIRTGG